MKFIKYISYAAAVACATSCNDIDDIAPEGGALLASQVTEITAALPERIDASFNSLYTMTGATNSCGYSTADDFGMIMMAFCNDLEGADAHANDNGYNWFSVCGEYSTRNANYRNPYIRYQMPYKVISNCNDFVGLYAESEDQDLIYKVAQARALRAWSYLQLAPNFQFNYTIAKDEPCIPMLIDTVADATHNPRVTVGTVYEYIIDELNLAVENLEGFSRSNKSYISQAVALGLRARAYLDMGEFQNAYNDADAAIAAANAEGIEPATIEEVSKPSFYDITETNWMWGYDMTPTVAAVYPYATSSSWLRSFSGNAYAAAVDVYCMINKMLYDKIPDTDVRKGWWMNEDNESPLLEAVTWDGVTGQKVATHEIADMKVAFTPYVNVKFGCFTYGTTVNEEDFPYMRIEEMYLIMAECQAALGNETAAQDILNNFVRTYRDPSYTAGRAGMTIRDEVWFQRRVELWGEGFGILDIKRLNKPLVRFHGDGTTLSSGGIGYEADAYAFNMANDDPWLLMRFPQGEMNTNFSIVDNTGGNLPTAGQNPDLRDGVTD